MITKADKVVILKALASVDVKKLQIEHEDPRIVKYFRFGSFTGIMIAEEIIKNLPETKTGKKIKVVDS